MVLYFPSGHSSLCFVFQLKTICFFLCGHFMSTAATWATVWCEKQIQLWGGMLCRKACVPGYVYVLSEDIQTSVLSSDLLPVSSVNKAHCAGVCTRACEGPLTAPRSENTGQSDWDKATQSHFPNHVLCEAASQLATPLLLRRDNNRSSCIPWRPH